MSGGLGNQMFVYALYKALQSAGKDVCIEDFTHYREIDRHDNNLEAVFPVAYKKGTKADYDRLTDSSLLPWNRIRRKLFGRKEKLFTERDAITFEKEVFDCEDCYCVGYWQSGRYFANVQEELRRDFTFDWVHFPKEALQYKKQMESTNSVSLHVRRGDYQSEKFAPIYGGICTEAYYKGAMEFFRKRFGACTFYLFTNDAEWGRSLAGGEIVYVDCADAGSAYIDMALMGSCRHNIIANSSFSWWGAWLNQNPEKIVAAPSKWLNTSDGQDIFQGLCNVKIDAGGQITAQEIKRTEA